MYKFRDITQVVEASESVLPSEALMINGEYIENLIPGYRTLNVAGRESLSPEIETFTTGVRDGSTKLSRRYPERIITITYQLVSKTNEGFREAFNTLAKVLNVEDAELIFNDEQDKYFIGTPYTIEEVEPGRKAVTGKFEILCADPFKYSVYEYEAEADLAENSILIDYNGTHKSFPILQAEFPNEDEASEDGETVQSLANNGDCGYVGFFNEEEKIIQVGDPDETDTVNDTSIPKSQVLINQKFDKTTSWGSAAKSLWTVNSGFVLNSEDKYLTGNVGIKEAPAKNVIVKDSITTQILKNVKSTASSPTFNYSVTCKAAERIEDCVKLQFAITVSLGKEASYFGKGYILKVGIYVDGSWSELTIKKENVRWEGTSAHTVTISRRVWGLSTTTSKITGVKFRATRGDSLGTAGTLSAVSCADVKIPAYELKEPTYYLAPTSYGSGTGKVVNSTCISRNVPADAVGEVGAANFSLSYTHQFCIGSGVNATKQKGHFQVNLSSADGTHIAGISIHKRSTGKYADLYFLANGRGVQLYPNAVDCTYRKDYFSKDVKHGVGVCKIEKFGHKISFTCAGYSITLVESSLAEAKVSKITFCFDKFTNSDVVTYNGISNVVFRKENCSTYRDVPNKFSSGDLLEVDCGSGEIFLNGISKPELGALGNDWETFYLKPGLNQIGIAYSEWVQEGFEPTLKVRYREVYI